MASTPNILLSAALAFGLWTCIGLPLAAHLAPRSIAPLLAPAFGWAVHSTLALPIFFAVGMSKAVIVVAFAGPVIVALAVLLLWRRPPGSESALGLALGPLVIVALIAAAALAVAVAAAVVPKVSADGVALAWPIFDHSKVGMIDEMARAGVPPVNPFYGGPGPARLSYYYLWHFSAAELAVLANVSGWEADAGLTWFTAFASLAVMMGLALWLSGRASSALWVVALAATGSMRPVLYAVFGRDNVDPIAGETSGFAGWLFQTSWAPQHSASATCAVLSLVLLVALMQRPRLVTLLVLAVTMAAAFESSTWVGGVAFPLAAAPIALMMLMRAKSELRLRIAVHVGAAALLALLLISPFLYDQLTMTALRASGAPIVFKPYEVLGGAIAGTFGGFANIPAYWLIYLAVEFPAFYLAGIVSLVHLLREKTLDAGHRSFMLASAILIAASLGAGGLLVSTLGDNNDLGWRAVLPAIAMLIVLSATGLSRWAVKPIRLMGVMALALVAIGIPDTFKIIGDNLVARAATPSKAFAAAPELWQAVGRVAAPEEHVANNPDYLDSMTPWSVNISWALMANRRSCYASIALVGPLTALSPAASERISAQFIRVFGGKAVAGDVEELAKLYRCKVAVVTPADGAWTNDPFAWSPFYRVADSSAAWRIYRATAN